ncbi:hypothetical protein AB0J90_24840 [Micromonospora sp. NPDC049523]|uniref:hypothetical protein n=1 Tax=Micromonospora sp. NPDC049523 TaxID=3155921 RepID=UPI003413BB5C
MHSKVVTCVKRHRHPGPDRSSTTGPGAIGVSYYAIDFISPFGPLKADGREYDPEGLSGYLDYKSIYTSAGRLPS